MRRSRFFVGSDNVDVSAKTIRITDVNQIRQMLTVLRLRIGEGVDLLDGAGNIYPSVISASTAVKGKIRKGDEIICKFDQVLPAGGEAAVRVTVVLPILRGARFEWALEKLTELGVAQIIPIVLDRSVVSYDGEEPLSASKFERWHAIVREAAEQCERALIPDVVAPKSFKAFLKRKELADAAKFIAAERSGTVPLVTAVESATDAHNIYILIGAEGGFTDDEFALAYENGFKPVTLGKRILRAETAALHAVSILMAQLDA